MADQIVDSSLIAATKQRNTKKEKDAIEAGRIPQDWQGQARKAATARPRLTLDGQVHQGQATGRQHDAAGRHRHSGFRLAGSWKTIATPLPLTELSNLPSFARRSFAFRRIASEVIFIQAIFATSHSGNHCLGQRDRLSFDEVEKDRFRSHFC